jgi:hypothetical protein
MIMWDDLERQRLVATSSSTRAELHINDSTARRVHRKTACKQNHGVLPRQPEAKMLQSLTLSSARESTC